MWNIWMMAVSGYVQVKDENGPIYMTIKYQNGWGSNRKKYMDPKEMWG